MTGPITRIFSLAILAAAMLLAGCSSSPKPIKIEPAVLSQSYDYTKPVDAAAKSRPVYILPTINYGWNPARTNDAGEWIGGHYTATVVEEGRWATLEEAEMAGKPYIYAGDSAPITPIPHDNSGEFQTNPPGQGPGPTGGGQAEIDMSNLAARLAKLEAEQPKLKEHFDSDEFLMAAATQRADDAKSGHALTPAGQALVEVQGLPPQNAANNNNGNNNSGNGDYSANTMVEVNRGSDLGIPPPRVDTSKSIAVASPGRSSTIVIQPRAPGTQETYAVPGSKDPLFVEYGANDHITITYRGVSQDAQFTNQRREISLSVPNLSVPPNDASSAAPAQ